jgi:alpha,alpha-trehalase
MIVTSKVRCSIAIALTSSRPAAGTSRQRNAKRAAAVSGIVVLTCLSSVCFADTQVGGTLPPPPDKLYGDLFIAVQIGQIYPDLRLCKRPCCPKRIGGQATLQTRDGHMQVGRVA